MSTKSHFGTFTQLLLIHTEEKKIEISGGSKNEKGRPEGGSKRRDWQISPPFFIVFRFPQLRETGEKIRPAIFICSRYLTLSLLLSFPFPEKYPLR